MIWKVGMIGAGYISHMHLQAWNKQPKATLAALCDLDRTKLEEKANRYGLAEHQLYTDADRMLKEADIDIVDITTPPDTHLELVRKAAAAGKHILCQKPFAPDLAQAEEMVAIAKEAGVRLMVTENWRWLPAIQRVKQILDSGTLGQIYYAKYASSSYFTPIMTPGKPLSQPYFRDMPRLLMYEMGTHWFDVWRFLFGEPERIYAEIRRASPYVVGDDVGTVLIGHHRFHGLMEMSWASRRGKSSLKQEMFYIETDRNSLLVMGDGTAKLLDESGETELNGPQRGEYNDTFVRLQQHFLDGLETGSDFQTSAEDNLRTLKLVFAAYESAMRRVVIRV